MYTSTKWFVGLVLPSNPLLSCFFQDKLHCAPSGFAYDTICHRTRCHITSVLSFIAVLSFIDRTSAAGILHICKSAVMKPAEVVTRFGNYCRMHSLGLPKERYRSDHKKWKEFNSKLTGKLLMDQRPENVQKSLKGIYHRQGS